MQSNRQHSNRISGVSCPWDHVAIRWAGGAPPQVGSVLQLRVERASGQHEPPPPPPPPPHGTQIETDEVWGFRLEYIETKWRGPPTLAGASSLLNNSTAAADTKEANAGPSPQPPTPP